MNIYTYFVLTLLFTISVSGCYDDDVIKFTPFEEKFENIDDFNESIAQFETVHIEDIEKEFFIEIDNILIYFKENALMNSDGEFLTGDADLVYKVFDSSKEMVLQNKPTVTFDGEPLHVFENFYFKIQQDGQDIEVDNSSRVKVFIDADESYGNLNFIYMFKYNTANDGWEPNDIISDSLMEKSWSIEIANNYFSGTGYTLVAPFNWSALGTFDLETMPEPENYVDFQVILNEEYEIDGQQYTISEPYTTDNTHLYLVQEESGSVLGMKENWDNQWRLPKIFKNQEATLIVLSEINNTMFFSMQKITIGEEPIKLSQTPLPIPVSEIIAKISTL